MKMKPLILLKWPQISKVDNEILKSFSRLFELISKIRKIRKEKNIPFKTKIELFTDIDMKGYESLILEKMCSISDIKNVKNISKNSFPFLLGTYKFYLNLPLDLNIDDEKKLLEKEINYYKGF